MNCEEVQMLMVEYLDNMLDNSEHKVIEAHLKSCEWCRNELVEFQSVLNAVSESKIEKPNESLRENFNYMLEAEKLKINNNVKTDNISAKRKLLIDWSLPLLKIAAALVLLVTGAIIGMNLKSVKENEQTSQFSELKSEVKDLKEMMMFTMLKEESPSERIKAVNFADEIPGPNKKVIAALINTINNDKNVNVRLAAVYSLSNFSNDPLVIDSFIEALDKEKEPIIQIVLINILAEKKVQKAIKPMQKIISNSKSIQEVKDIAEKGIKVLL